jgi:hypothetical protein
MIKSHRLYNFYISYLAHKKEQDIISDGAISLLKISESAFNDFVYDYENNHNFKQIIDDIHKKESRDEKIIDLLNGPDRRNHSQ